MSHMGTNNTSDQEDEAFANAMQISSSFIVPIVFNTVIELGLLDIIAKNKEITPSELATHLPTKNKDAIAMLDSMLRLLTTHSILKCSLSDTQYCNGELELLYQLASAGKFFVQEVHQGRPYSLTPFFRLTHDVRPTDYGYHLKDAVLEGGPCAFERAFGSSLFKWYDANPDFSKRFDMGMSAQSSIIGAKVLEKYKGFLGIKSLVDVGGGIGTNLSLIASKYPSIKCINFDLSHVIKEAPVQVGIEHIAGDMFVAIPKTEAILLKFVCHNWDDEHCIKLLKKCYEALPENGKVILVELISPAIPSTSIADKYISQLDNIMLSIHGTRERNLSQFEALSKAAGFSKIQIQCRARINSVVEIFK